MFIITATVTFLTLMTLVFMVSEVFFVTKERELKGIKSHLSIQLAVVRKQGSLPTLYSEQIVRQLEHSLKQGHWDGFPVRQQKCSYKLENT